MEVRNLAFDEIETSDRIRDLDTEKLARLKISMEQVGQMTPVEVIEHSGKAKPYRLVAGLHRIAAAQAAGLKGINAIIYSGNADAHTLRLREIDENLARAELSQYDRANFIAERAKLWVAMHGEIKRGRPRKGQNVPNPFIRETCEKFGIPEREIKRSRQIFESVSDAVWSSLRGTPVADNATQLRKIGSLEPKKQSDFLDRIRPSFDLPKKQFDLVFNVAFAEIGTGQKHDSAKTPDELAEYIAKKYRRAAPAVQRLFRKKVGLVYSAKNAASPADA